MTKHIVENIFGKKITFWKSVAVIIAIVGVYSLFIRFTKGLGASTNLSDLVPWGLWIGFDFIGVGLGCSRIYNCSSCSHFS